MSVFKTTEVFQKFIQNSNSGAIKKKFNNSF